MSCVDAPSLYEIPLVLHDEGLDDYICTTLHLADHEPDLTDWRQLVAQVEAATEPVRIGLVGKYTAGTGSSTRTRGPSMISRVGRSRTTHG